MLSSAVVIHVHPRHLLGHTLSLCSPDSFAITFCSLLEDKGPIIKHYPIVLKEQDKSIIEHSSSMLLSFGLPVPRGVGAAGTSEGLPLTRRATEAL